MPDFIVFVKDNLVVSVVVVVVMIGIFVYVMRGFKGKFFGFGGHIQKKTPLINSHDLEHDNESSHFIPVSEFDGYKRGYVFKTADKGTGYYKDITP